jgi:bleomycin hydrolase
MKLLLLIVFVAFLSPFVGFTQEEKEVFLIEKEIKHLPVIRQGRTGTCWSFATTSFLESEIIRKGMQETDLSEMYFVKYGYKNKLEKYLMYHGNNNFGQGGLSHDVIDVLREKGMTSYEAFPGKKIDGTYSHGELVNELKDEIAEINKKRKDFNAEEADKLKDVLVEHIGESPEKVKIEDKNYAPNEVAGVFGINPDDYVEFTSYSHHPYYKQFVLEVPDNWSHALYYNLPVDELMHLMQSALNNGFSVCWDGDVSEKFFIHKDGKADLPDDEIGKVDQELRQKTFMERKTTDDHLMHLVGLSKDSKGRLCYYTKNSWGPESNQHGGYLHMTEDYVRLKTVGIMVHKDAIPAEIKTKLIP